jgi:dipeptidyl aminopeptidase/acylaminoacyl peptidase
MLAPRTTPNSKDKFLPSKLRLLLVISLAVAAPLASFCSSKDVSSKTVTCAKAKFRYVLYTPQKTGPLPALLILHGAGDQPEPMLEAWKSLAKKQGIVLIAPELPRVEAFEQFAPQVFRCEVEDAKKSVLLDPQRIYIFGHSMGGYLGYDAAMLESRYFAAAAIHGMGISEDYYWIIGKAERKTPVAIYVGDSEQPVIYERARKTIDLLRKENFPVHFVELRDHDHNYYAMSDHINEDAWNFLKDKTLPNPQK